MTTLTEDARAAQALRECVQADAPAHTRILIIDDTPAIHEDFRKALTQVETPALDEAAAALFGRPPPRRRRSRFVLDSAYQGQDGLALLQQGLAEGRRYALALVDVRMPPGWDGIETISKLWEADPDLQVMICTAHSDYSWEDTVERLGDSESLVILKKPFDRVEVLQLAHALTRKWLLTRQSKRRLADLDSLVNERTRELTREVGQRSQAQESLREANDRLRALFRASPLAIVVSDVQGKIQMWNQAAERIFGWSEREVLGKEPPFVPQAQRPATSQLWARVVGGEEIHAQELRQWHKKDGSVIDLLWSCAPLRDSQGVANGTIAVYTDITEKKQLEVQFLRAQRLESIGQLAGGIAHDLNNILAPIVMCAPLLREEICSQDGLAVLNTMEASARRGTEIVKQVLTFARGMAGDRVLLQPQQLVREIAKIVQETFPRSITIEIDAPKDIQAVSGDPTQLHQVLLNLAVNARDAMPEGGALKLAAEDLRLREPDVRGMPGLQPGPYVLLRVSDTGIGIPPEITERIFDPFFTTKGLEKGTGLGLSTVRGIVKSHGGFVDFTSNPGKGTEFRIYLPAQKRSDSSAAAAAPASPPKGHGELILIVDDEPAVRSITQRTLESFGYRTLLASNGTEALALYTEKGAEIALVLTDMNMPPLDGRHLISAIRELNPKARVVVASGGISADQLAAEKEQGVQAILKKPFEAALLLSTVHRVLADPARPAA